MSKFNKNEDELSVPAALAILAAVGLAATGKVTVPILTGMLESLDVIRVHREFFFTFSVLSIIGNITLLAAAIKQAVSKTKHGSRLKAFAGAKVKFKAENTFLRDLCIAAFVGGIAFGVSYILPLSGLNGPRLSSFQREVWEWVSLIGSVSIGFGASLVTAMILKSNLKGLWRRLVGNRLPPFPSVPNTITIGAINEDKK